MFERFRKKSLQRAIAESPVGRMFDQIALATAVAQTTREYLRSRNGISIVKEDKASVIELWSGIRFEAISELWRPGSVSSNELVADPTTHPKLLNAIIERSASYLRAKKSQGDELDDTISAILRIYDYLAQLEYDVCSPYLQHSKESPGYVPRYAGFVEEMRKLHLKWQGYSYALSARVDLPIQPDTVFVTVWRNVTYRSKIIALCAGLGPRYLANFAAIKKEHLKDNERVARLDNLIVRILMIDDPEQLQHASDF
jgi:hypothetical protein